MAKTRTRTNYPEDFRIDIVRQFYDARKTDPELSGAQFAKSVSITDGLFSTWRARYGYRFGDTSATDVLTPAQREAIMDAMKKDRPKHEETAKKHKVPVTTLLSWVSRHGDQLRAEMGLPPASEDAASADAASEAGESQTMVSSGTARLTKRGKKIGRPSNAEMASRKSAWRAQAGLATVPPAPHEPPERRVFLERGGPTLQPDLPFTADPVRREEPRPPEPRAESGAPSPADFLRDTTARALRERDAVITTLEIMMREGRLPGMGQR